MPGHIYIHRVQVLYLITDGDLTIITDVYDNYTATATTVTILHNFCLIIIYHPLVLKSKKQLERLLARDTLVFSTI